MVNRKIIAFYSPYTRAGKSTAAKLTGGLIYSFATPIKHMAELLYAEYGYGIRDYYELRDLHIAIGQGLKQFDPDIWVRIMSKEMGYLSEHLSMTIDDLRFPNEYAMLKDKGAKIVRITNPEREIVKTETEGLLEGFEFDYELINCKRSFEEYRTQIDKMMSELWP